MCLFFFCSCFLTISFPTIFSCSGITKRDQYRRMKAFDLSVLQKQEMAEQNVLSGHKAARHHEQKLEDVRLEDVRY